MPQDLRYGVRMLFKAKGFTFVAVLSLALGIGANTALFSVMDAVLLKTLPVTEPERLAGYGLSRLLASQYFGADAWQRQVAEQLYGVKTNDPLTFAVIASLLTLAALIACWLPARKASRVDPLTALRHE